MVARGGVGLHFRERNERVRGQ
ncbi:MAG: hypothetical protein QOI75_6991, partial [Pseudonocardiales bacterium]|nr:hypothetical protein [Pseudonocardiales bacterium]